MDFSVWTVRICFICYWLLFSSHQVFKSSAIANVCCHTLSFRFIMRIETSSSFYYSWLIKWRLWLCVQTNHYAFLIYRCMMCVFYPSYLMKQVLHLLQSPRYIPSFCSYRTIYLLYHSRSPFQVGCCIVIYHIVHMAGCKYALHQLHLPQQYHRCPPTLLRCRTLHLM